MNEENSIEQFQRRCLELAGSLEQSELVQKYTDLEMDFEYIKSLNTELSAKYQELMDCFPTVAELDLLLKELEIKQIVNNPINTQDEQFNSRISKLKKFRSALVALEKQDIHAQNPPKYEDIDQDETQISQ